MVTNEEGSSSSLSSLFLLEFSCPTSSNIIASSVFIADDAAGIIL